MKCYQHNSPYTLICQVKDCPQKLLCNNCMVRHNAQHYPMIQSLSDMDYQIKQVPQLVEKDLETLKSKLYSLQNHITIEKDQIKKQLIKLGEVLKSRLNAEVDEFCQTALDYANSYYKGFENDLAVLVSTIAEHLNMVAPYSTRVRPINENQFSMLIDFQDKMLTNIIPTLTKKGEVLSKSIFENQLTMRTDNLYAIVRTALSNALQSHNLYTTNIKQIEQKRAYELEINPIQSSLAKSALIPTNDYKKSALEILRNDNNNNAKMYGGLKSARHINNSEAFNLPKLKSTGQLPYENGNHYIYVKELNTILSGHVDIVLCLCIFTQTQIISGGGGGIIKIWDIDGGLSLGQLNEHSGDVWSLAKINENQFASASADQTVRIWNYQRMICETILIGHQQTVKTLLYLKDIAYLASGSLDTTIKIWTTDRPKIKMTIQDNQRIRALCYVQSKGLLVSGGENNLSVFNILNGYCRDQLEGHRGEVLALQYLHDSMMGEYMSIIASGGSDKKIIIWNLDRAIKLHVFVGHQEAVTCFAFDEQNFELWSGGADRQLRCWDIRNAKQIIVTKRHSDQISCLVYMISRELLISGSWDHRIRITGRSILLN